MDALLYELKQAYGQEAEFREGQFEAVQGVLSGKRTLIVQRTGWGKSLVYFLATKVLRKNQLGITIIISPLLALMNNQIDSADKFGISVETINSSNREEWDNVIDKLKNNDIDALIISPERLANEEFKALLVKELTAQIGLFVVDEAHCISDWGHDFRPDYRRIVDIIQQLPSNIPVLATTATANDRVINDIKKQLGEDIFVSRGSLMRESLELQVIELNSKEERMAWILEHINSLPGTGIIYCLTVNDCKLLNKWLNANGVVSESYYADIENAEEKDKIIIIDLFMNNQIKVLVATVAFGMGFDKSDIGFVIHFQKPGNIVAYYQQIGRAGRGIEKAFAILLRGDEDDEINKYFIESAFPTEGLMNDVIHIISSSDGIKRGQIESGINMKVSKINACIKYLMVNGDIYMDNKKYYKTPRPWVPDIKRSKVITEIRKNELQQMDEFIKTDMCSMEFIAKALDDLEPSKCGKCSNCMGKEIISSSISREVVIRAQQFIKADFNIIEPRKKWPIGVRIDEKNMISVESRCEVGRVLSNYGDAGWGKLISTGKYKENYFDEQLVDASCELLKEFVETNNIELVTNIPSLRRPVLVKCFAERIATKLNLQYIETIDKIKDVRCQKEFNNSYMQYENAYNSFGICSDVPKNNILLIDDMVDSRWTFAVCGYKLRCNGSGKVYPFALANSVGRNGED